MVLNFVCRQSKKRRDGLSPIELSIIINGERSIITLDRRVLPTKFNSVTGKVKGDKEVNEYLEVIKKKCYNIETELIKTDSLNIKTFVDVFRNGFKAKVTTLLQIYDIHNELYQKDVNCGRVGMDALKKYRMSRIRLAEYIKTLGKDDIRIQDVTPSFCTGYQSYCLSSLKVSTTNKELKMFKRILQFAVDERYLDINPFNIKIKEEKIHYNPLTLEDVMNIWNTVIDNERLSQIRDCFIFQCFTGLAYCDMATLTKADIQDGVIYKNRKKTDVKSVIPLLPIPKAILERYSYKLPVISNQKYNQLLKALKELCNIRQNLTSHMGRHTAATVMINNGIELPIIAKILGHSNTKITEKVYATVREKTIVDNANRIQQAFSL